jgi:CheY-like chemotaxis protein
VGNDHLDAQTSARLIKRAVLLTGGRAALAATLGVRESDLEIWIDAKTFPPQAVFEKVLTVILDAADRRPAPPSAERALAERPRDRVLVADNRMSFAAVARILGDEFSLVPAHTVTDALDILQGAAVAGMRSVDAVLCGQHFDGSQMLHFLQCVKAYPGTRDLPFICYRGMPTQLSDAGLGALRETCEALGAIAYVDLAYPNKPGVEARAVEFLEAVRAAVRLRVRPQALRILVADDNPDAAHTLAVLLRMEGHEVRKVNRGREALAAGETFAPSVVILDIAMPDMSGYDVARSIRETAWGRRATLIAVTGYAGAENAARSFAAGFDHHFAKPVTLAELSKAFPRPRGDEATPV